MKPNEKLAVRWHMADYMLRSERNEPAIDYAQIRRMRTLGWAPEMPKRIDCSEYATDVYFWSWKHNGLGVMVPDPNGLNYNGEGWTGTLRSHNPNHVPFDHVFFVGDMAQYEEEDHVTICRRQGTFRTAVFSSHGQKAGPFPTQLWSYRRDELLYVCRPASLA